MNGLWTVEFGSSVGISGGGVAVFSNGKILGGDGGYYYTGNYEVRDQTFHAKLTVSPFISGMESVFRTIGRTVHLELSGTFSDDSHAIAQGNPVEMPALRFGAKLTKRSAE